MRKLSIACLVVLAFASPALAGTDWGKECASYGLAVGSAEYRDCVAKMTDADKATGGTMGQDMKSNSGNSARAAQMRTDMDKQRTQMQARMNRQMQDAKSNPKCKTVTNGTNTVTQCP